MPGKKTVLVAEDDADVRDLIRVYLQMCGYEVQVARNGAEALDKLRGALPDAVVLDINMPVVDGFAVLEHMADAPVRPPVLVLTARHAAGDVQRAVKLGARDFLAKPFSENQLAARVGRLVRGPLGIA
jgi:DNA-binding response OmpR family regulator